MRIKTVRKKGKMKPKEKGKPLTHKKLVKPKNAGLKTIKGIFNGWSKAPKFVLRLKSTIAIRYYLSKKEELTPNIKEAMQFAVGYDNPVIKVEYWSRQLGVQFREEKI